MMTMLLVPAPLATHACDFVFLVIMLASVPFSFDIVSSFYRQPWKCMLDKFFCDWGMGSQQAPTVFKSIPKCRKCGDCEVSFFKPFDDQ
jgi:hypothetical protein